MNTAQHKTQHQHMKNYIKAHTSTFQSTFSQSTKPLHRDLILQSRKYGTTSDKNRKS